MQKFQIINELNSTQIQQLIRLFQQAWWANSRPLEDIEVMLKTCVSFAIIDNETQNLVAYARVLTDQIKYGYIYDVIADKSMRGKGLGKMLMQAIISYPPFKKLKNFELTCEVDMMPFYQQFGFSDNYNHSGREVKAMRLSKSAG